MSEHFIDFLADELRWNGKPFLPLSNDPGTPGQPGPVSWNDVQNKPQKFPPQEHSHSVTDIGDLEQKLTEIVTDGEIVVKGEKGDPGEPGKDGETPDLSIYATKTYVEEMIAEIVGNFVQNLVTFDHVPTQAEIAAIPTGKWGVFSCGNGTQPPEYCDICGAELIDGQCPNNHDGPSEGSGDSYDNSGYGYGNGDDNGYNPNLPITTFGVTSVTAETVTLAWSFRSDITDDSIDGINLYYKAAYETSGFVDYAMGTSIEWTGETVTGLEPGQTYEFYLEVSFYGEPYQYASPVVTVTTHGDGYGNGYGEPLHISNFRCTGCTASTIELAWEQNFIGGIEHRPDLVYATDMLYRVVGQSDWVAASPRPDNRYAEYTITRLAAGIAYEIQYMVYILSNDIGGPSILDWCCSDIITVTTSALDTPPEYCDICGAVLVNGKCPNNHGGPDVTDDGTTEGGDSYYENGLWWYWDDDYDAYYSILE